MFCLGADILYFSLLTILDIGEIEPMFISSQLKIVSKQHISSTSIFTVAH